MTKTLKARLFIALTAFAVVIVLGISGFMIIADYGFLDAVYMTVITISTVGYGETKPLSMTGKIFVICLIFCNVITVGYSVAMISSFFLEADLVKKYKTNKMNKRISELRNHVIVCGYGRTGREAVSILKSNHMQTVVVENLEKPLETLKNMGDQLYVSMDAITNEALLTAGIEHARALITTLPNDADNVFVTLTAAELNPGVLIVSRATHSTSISKLKKAGAANVIMPYKIGGAHMASLVVNPDVKEFIDLVSGHTGFSAHIEEIDLSVATGNLIGKTIGEIGLHSKTGVNIIGLKIDGHYVINPEDSAIVETGHKLLVIGTQPQFARLKNFMAGK